MAENRAGFSLRRPRSLGFSKCRWVQTTLSVPSRSIFFLSRRRALSTDSPFFNLISVKSIHFLSKRPWDAPCHHGRASSLVRTARIFFPARLSIGKIGSKAACVSGPFRAFSEMGLPSQPVTLSIEQLDELNKKLSTMRHDINNHLSLIMAAVGLLRHKTQLAERMIATLIQQPPRGTEAINKIFAQVERTMGNVPHQPRPGTALTKKHT